MFGCRVMAWDKQTGYFGAILAVLVPWEVENSKIFKNKKIHLEILFYTSVPKLMIKWHLVAELWLQQRDMLVWANYHPLTSLPGLPNKKKWKRPRYITILHQCIKNYNHIMISYRNTAWDKETGHFGLIFALLPPDRSKN